MERNYECQKSDIVMCLTLLLGVFHFLQLVLPLKLFDIAAETCQSKCGQPHVSLQHARFAPWEIAKN